MDLTTNTPLKIGCISIPEKIVLTQKGAIFINSTCVVTVRLTKFLRFLSFLSVLFIKAGVHGQCASPISSFPYTESFENSDGGWVVSGFAPDWVWGSPQKPVINRAGGGNNCWVTGGLTGSFYNNGEASWLQSPCFDFTNLVVPYINFKVFWETEGGYDGANLQYSIDNGNSWLNAGSVSTPSTCYNNNWYNTATVSFLSAFTPVRGGWSGNVQSGSGNCRGGGGSGDWVVADQVLRELAGQKSVIFRFTFAAGTQCNGFDGFGIDDISISEVPTTGGNINYTCSANRSVGFSFVGGQCPDNYSWDFGDIASGQNNTSTQAKPQHVFSSAGTYNVQVTVSTFGSTPFTTSQTITVLDASAYLVSPGSCNGGATGSAGVTVTGSPGPFAYSWNTSPAQTTNIATNLPAGNYTVNVSAQDACTASATIELINPSINVSSAVQQPGCLFEKGSIVLSVTGGEQPYNFSWFPSVSNSATAENLLPGNYSVNVTNAGPCLQQLNFTIANLPKPIISFTNITAADCNGIKRGSALAVANGGTPPYSFSWNTNPVQTTDSAINLIKGIFTAVVTDANGCTDTSEVTIGANGICNDVYFPSAFTPNATQNNLFGPLGNVIDINNYGINIFNRFGQLVFSSNNPLIKWDGTFKGRKVSAGVYIWYASYNYKSTFKKIRKGTIALLR